MPLPATVVTVLPSQTTDTLLLGRQGGRIYWVLQPGDQPVFSMTTGGERVRVPMLRVPIRDTDLGQVLAAGMKMATLAMTVLRTKTIEPILEARIYYATEAAEENCTVACIGFVAVTLR